MILLAAQRARCSESMNNAERRRSAKLGLPHPAPFADSPGGTGPEVAAAGWDGTQGREAVGVPSRATPHRPPDGAEATSGGALEQKGGSAEQGTGCCVTVETLHGNTQNTSIPIHHSSDRYYCISAYLSSFFDFNI